MEKLKENPLQHLFEVGIFFPSKLLLGLNLSIFKYLFSFTVFGYKRQLTVAFGFIVQWILWYYLLSSVLQVYVQVNKEAEHSEDIKLAAKDFFRQLEQHENQAMSLWQQFREITVKEYQHIYKVSSLSETQTQCET